MSANNDTPKFDPAVSAAFTESADELTKQVRDVCTQHAKTLIATGTPPQGALMICSASLMNVLVESVGQQAEILGVAWPPEKFDALRNQLKAVAKDAFRDMKAKALSHEHN